MHSTASPGLPEIKAGILIGGLSSRMGQPKQLLELDDRPLLDYPVESLTCFDQVSLIGEGPVPEHHRGLSRLNDADGFRGPLAGIIGALRSDPSTGWVIVACDQPWVTQTAIEWLLQQRRPNSTAVIPHHLSQPQPFPGIYEASFLTTVISRANCSSVGVSSLARLPEVHSPELPRGLLRAWASVNTPKELTAASVRNDHADT